MFTAVNASKMVLWRVSHTPFLRVGLLTVVHATATRPVFQLTSLTQRIQVA
jgi:hypothetical protein